MHITEVQVTVAADAIQQRDGVMAFAKVIFDNTFCLRDVKVMSHEGCIFLGMPARKKMQSCPACQGKVFFTDRFCSSCGEELDLKRPSKPYLDVCYPIVNTFRRYMEKQIMANYNGQVAEDRHLRLRDE